jgi:diaminohydroxyphosphoribosylaminopyrimidine deaminase/5-amino-6-(5-phosphoribosylamino)uracil reductase
MNEHDIRFMQRALELARKGVGLASPNPTVGCVIIRGENHRAHIVGEGFHQYDLRDHAEIVALNVAGENARGATAYVTLEPCNLTGRTGPCTQALLQAGIARVVVATEDPNPQIAGRGIEILRDAGVTVEIGISEPEARQLNYGFARWITAGRPFVTLKSALTLDGQLSLSASKKLQRREWITSEESRAEVQKMRHAADAIITGIGTIVADDPLLTDRSGLPRRRRLLRVVLDSTLRLSARSRIVKSADNDLLVFTAASMQSANAKRLQAAGVELCKIPARAGRLNLKAILRVLGRRQIQNAMLECGPGLNTAALAARTVDRLVLFYAAKVAGHTKTPFCLAGQSEIFSFRQKNYREYGPDFAVDALLHDSFDS